MATSEIEPRSRQMGLAAAVLGMALVAISFLPAVAGDRDRWTAERAREYQDASMRIQQLTHQLGDEQPESVNRATEGDYQQAIGQFQDLQAELNQARSDHGLLKVALRVLGGALGVAGIAYYFASKRDQAENA